MRTEQFTIIVPEEFHLERIDKFLCSYGELDFSRSYLQRLIHDGDISVCGKAVKPNYKVKTDDEIVITVPEPKELDLLPADLPLDIVYEDDSIAVINKAPGMVVHPGPGNWDKTMVNALLHHLKNLSSIGGTIRPGIVHRLDKDTAGLMVVAKNDHAHARLADCFAERTINKRYRALVIGKPASPHEIINRPIGRHPKYREKMTVIEGGREAITEFTIQKIWNTSIGTFTLLDIILHTGRTHQIRVHLSSSGIPIVADPVYSKKWTKYKVPYLLLASIHLSFAHPETNAPLSFDVPLPEHIVKFMNRLETLCL